MNHIEIIYNSLFSKWKNIYLIKSSKWNYCNLIINNKTIATLQPDKEYMIEIQKIHTFKYYKPIPTLFVNNMIYYEYNNMFNLNIVLELNTHEDIYDIIRYIDNTNSVLYNEIPTRN